MPPDPANTLDSPSWPWSPRTYLLIVWGVLAIMSLLRVLDHLLDQKGNDIVVQSLHVAADGALFAGLLLFIIFGLSRARQSVGIAMIALCLAMVKPVAEIAVLVLKPGAFGPFDVVCVGLWAGLVVILVWFARVVWRMRHALGSRT